jgi:lipoprotein signal peptidase
VTATVVVVLDLVVGYVARVRLPSMGRPSWGPIQLALSHNGGVSFSWLQHAPLLALALSLLVGIALVAVGLRCEPGQPALGLGLVLGGGAANAADRLAATTHQVTDYLVVPGWFVCNVADVANTLGVVLLLVVMVRGRNVLAK